MLEETFDENPMLCRDFVIASIRGWEYAFAHPEEALDIIMAQLKKVYVPATRVHQRWMLNRMQDLMIHEEQRKKSMGHLDAKDYHRVGNALLEYQMISGLPAFSEFHKKVIKNEN